MKTFETIKVPFAPQKDWIRFAGGGEAIIYELPNSDLAKIFRHWDDLSESEKQNPALIASLQNKFWTLQTRLAVMPPMPENVIKPKKLVTSLRGSVIGYTMDKVINTVSIEKYCRLADLDGKLTVLRELYDLIESLHAIDVIIGDLVPRDISWLTGEEKIYLFDIEGMSYANYSCQAFSFGYVDRNLLEFYTIDNQVQAKLVRPYEKISDWVSFLAICLNVMVGLDPYEGVHSDYKTKAERVKDDISIFSPGVNYPDSIPTLDTIPRALLEKIFLTFRQGFREKPEKEILDNH